MVTSGGREWIDSLPEGANVSHNVAATRVVDRYLSTVVSPALPKEPHDQLGTAITGLTLRGIALVQALAKLDRPSHLQLVMAANRSMLEILVDLILLTTAEDAVAVVEMLEAWELSARYKVALNHVAYKEERGGGLTDLEQPLVNFIERQGDRVNSARRLLWPNRKGRGRHPNRWTGRNLLEDIRRADELTAFGLEDYYHEEYGRMNFQVHGSSLAGQRGLGTAAFTVWFCMGHKKTCEFAFYASERAMDFLGLLDGGRRQELDAARTEWAIRIIGFGL